MPSVLTAFEVSVRTLEPFIRYSTDVANTEQLLRLIQSIPSPKAVPMKMWLAQVGKERIEETIAPEQAIDRIGFM